METYTLFVSFGDAAWKMFQPEAYDEVLVNKRAVIKKRDDGVNPNKIKFVGYYLGLVIFVLDLDSAMLGDGTTAKSRSDYILPLIKDNLHFNSVAPIDGKWTLSFQWTAIKSGDLTAIFNGPEAKADAELDITPMPGASGGSTVQIP